MTISLNDIYTWKDWGVLPQNFRDGLQKTYASPQEAIGVLKGVESWLISRLPKKDTQERLELTTLFKEKIADISHTKVMRVRSCGNQAIQEFFVLPQFEQMRADSQAVFALKKAGITLPKQFTCETQYLFEQLLNSKMREKQLQSNEVGLWWDKAVRSYEIDMLPHAWIEKLQNFFDQSDIKEILDKAQMTIASPLTRETLHCFCEELMSKAMQNYAAQKLKEEYVRFIERLQMFADPLKAEERGKDWEELASDKISQLEKILRENHDDWNDKLLHIFERPVIKKCILFAKVTLPTDLTKDKFIQFLDELPILAKDNQRIKLILPYLYWELEDLLKHQVVVPVLSQQVMSPSTSIPQAEEAKPSEEEEFPQKKQSVSEDKG